jgi:FemAB-related protein (PEP-CTERM system-associated)
MPGTSTAASPRVERLSPEREAAWDAFVASHPAGSHYQRAGWSRVLSRAFGPAPHYLLVAGPDGIEGVLPLFAFAHPIFGRSLVSVPFLNRGGLLTASARARDALLAEARALLASTRSRYVELRHAEASDPSLPCRSHKISMSLALDGGEAAVWERVGAKVRNLVRKGQKAGLAARRGDPARDLEAFYDLFARNMRDLGTPVYTCRFFREVFREFPDDVRLTMVEQEGRAVAAGLQVAHGGFTEMHWAASRREALPLSPNMLLYWECIAEAARAGRREFCFGRSTEGSGPHRFKKQWGASPTRLHWEYLLAPGAEPPRAGTDDPRFQLAIRVWRRLPLGVTRLLGPPIVRHLP